MHTAHTKLHTYLHTFRLHAKKNVHTNTNFECLCTLYVKDLDAFQVSEVNSSAVLRNVAEALMNSELF